MPPLACWIAIPVGFWSSPLPEPGLPNVLTGLNKDARAVVAPDATPSTQTARTTPATRAGSRRTLHKLPKEHAGLVLPATRSKTRDGFITVQSSSVGCGGPGGRGPDWHVSFPL